MVAGKNPEKRDGLIVTGNTNVFRLAVENVRGSEQELSSFAVTRGFSISPSGWPGYLDLDC